MERARLCRRSRCLVGSKRPARLGRLHDALWARTMKVLSRMAVSHSAACWLARRLERFEANCPRLALELGDADDFSRSLSSPFPDPLNFCSGKRKL